MADLDLEGVTERLARVSGVLEPLVGLLGQADPRVAAAQTLLSGLASVAGQNSAATYNPSGVVLEVQLPEGGWLRVTASRAILPGEAELLRPVLEAALRLIGGGVEPG